MPLSQPVKILFVITQGEWGGAQRYVFDLATNLANTPPSSPPKLGGEGGGIAVIMGSEKTELAKRLKQKNIEILFADHLRRSISPLHDLLAIFELKRLFEKIKPDIVHLNSSKAGVIGSLAAHLAGVPRTVFTAHGFAFLEPQPWIMKQLYYWTERFACLFRDKIICVSEFDRQAAIRMKLCPAEKLVTIHNGISVSSLPLVGRVREGVIIGTIAHLYKTKGLNYLIDAARDIDAKFEIIGDGPEKKNLDLQLTTYNLQHKVQLLGEKENAEQYLSSFDIFVLPSVKEGFPYTILEAMAAGKPIVATNVGGIPEALGDAGILVPPKDPQELVQAIQSLIDDPHKAKRLGQSARERVKNFTLEKMTSKTIAVYNSL